MKKIHEIDRNFSVPPEARRPDTVFYSALKPPFSLHGVFFENGCFRRCPEALARRTNDGVLLLHAHTAGGRLRFITNSPFIVLRAEMHVVSRMPHFALTGSAGFDVYADNVFTHCFVPPFEISEGYTAAADLPGEAEREITLHFPLYSGVKALYIGLKKGCLLKAPAPYRTQAPVVYYGSSITQGGCASRPGLAYQNILSRRLRADHLNLGFSGSAKGEQCMAQYIAGLGMSAFVMDYDHNAPTPAHLANTHEAFFQTVRAQQPNLPVVFLSRPKYALTPEEEERLSIIRRTYENALRRGDENVYLLTGPQLTALCGNEGTVDGCHPNDLGFSSMAAALAPVLEGVLR